MLCVGREGRWEHELCERVKHVGTWWGARQGLKLRMEAMVGICGITLHVPGYSSSFSSWCLCSAPVVHPLCHQRGTPSPAALRWVSKERRGFVPKVSLGCGQAEEAPGLARGQLRTLLACSLWDAQSS